MAFKKIFDILSGIAEKAKEYAEEEPGKKSTRKSSNAQTQEEYPDPLVPSFMYLNSEEDILRAIDMLTDDGNKKSDKQEDVQKGYSDDELVYSVPKPKLWSLFKYLINPPLEGLKSRTGHQSLHFTVPCGWEWSSGVKMWFITFPANGSDDDITEFFTLYDPTSSE